jgi:hypothetical protein
MKKNYIKPSVRVKALENKNSLLSASGPDTINNSYTDSPALSKKPIFNFMDDDNEAAAHSNDIEW